MAAPRYCAAFAAALVLSLGISHAQDSVDGSLPGRPVTGPAAAIAPELRQAQRQNAQGQHDEALRTVEGYLSNHADDPRGLFLRGVILADLGRTREAIDVFNQLTA